jgi:hypothetical protein
VGTRQRWLILAQGAAIVVNVTALCCCFSIVDHKGCNSFFCVSCCFNIVDHGECNNFFCVSCCFNIVDHKECNNFFCVSCCFSIVVHRLFQPQGLRALIVSATNLNVNLQFELFQHLYISDQWLSTRVM